VESLKANCEPPFVNAIKIIMINIAPTCQASQHVTTCESPEKNIVFQNKNKLHGTSDTHQHVIARCKTIFIDNMCESQVVYPTSQVGLQKMNLAPSQNIL
jgi:hypothetical protein